MRTLIRLLEEQQRNALDGMRKPKALKFVNDILGKYTKGNFRDNGWAPIQAIRTALAEADVAFEQLDGSGTYEKENGVDVRKRWKYKVMFQNQNDRADQFYISIVASGAGPSDDPLSIYDVTAYAQ